MANEIAKLTAISAAIILGFGLMTYVIVIFTEGTKNMSEKINNQLDQMLSMQNELNKAIHPDWVNQRFDWFRAIWIECAELMDKIGWKWWKKQTLDRDQAVLELVDIWHFILSEAISGEEIEDFKTDAINSILALKKMDENALDSIESIADEAIDGYLSGVVFWFFESAQSDQIQLSFDELYRMYAGKYVLNKFRQDHGYKTGEYCKTWHDGREDNEHLMEIIKICKDDGSFQNDVYKCLTFGYSIPEHKKSYA